MEVDALMCCPGDGGAEHVLLIDGFSPLVQTKDLEDLLRPYSNKVSIRWIDDTSVAAVFRTPALGIVPLVICLMMCPFDDWFALVTERKEHPFRHFRQTSLNVEVK